jgi:hypothetical protein
VHYVHERVDADLPHLLDALVGHGPVEFAAAGFDLVPRQRVAQVRDAQLLAGAPEVVAPEAVVLGPFKLIDVEMREERALDARAPDELREGEVIGGTKRHSRMWLCCETASLWHHARTLSELKSRP